MQLDDPPIKFDSSEKGHVIEVPDFRLVKTGAGMLGPFLHYENRYGKLFITPRRVLFAEYLLQKDTRRKVPVEIIAGYKDLLFDLSLEHIDGVTLGGDHIGITIKKKYESLYLDLMSAGKDFHYFSLVPNRQTLESRTKRYDDEERREIAKRVATTILRNKDDRAHELDSSITVKHTGEVVHYNIATSFNFGSDGVLQISCPYCKAPKPQTDSTSQVVCPHCGQTYKIPKKILDML